MYRPKKSLPKQVSQTLVPEYYLSWAPGSEKKRIPGAKTGHFAPGIRYFLLPGAENSLFAPGKLPKSNGEGDWETSGWCAVPLARRDFSAPAGAFKEIPADLSIRQIILTFEVRLGVADEALG